MPRNRRNNEAFDENALENLPRNRLNMRVVDYPITGETSDTGMPSFNRNTCIDMMLNYASDGSNEVCEDSNSSGGSLFSPFTEGRTNINVPKHSYWSTTKELYNREIGNYKNNGAIWSNKFYQSLVAVQKLKLSKQLIKHSGCVNALDFNASGNVLVSGGDDCQIGLWDWSKGKCLYKYYTPHTLNIFQTKFLSSQGGDHIIISSSRDGLIVLSYVNNSGHQYNKVLTSHHGSCNKFSVHHSEPFVVLSCGDDGIVKKLDIRNAPNNERLGVDNILSHKYSNGNFMHLYGIDINPMNPLQFIVNGDDEYVRMYDKRNLASGPVKKFCSLFSNSNQTEDDFNNSNSASTFQDAHITSAVYNYCGTEILASYSEDDIYLFDVNGCPETYIHHYSGHLNRATIKGVNFFGPRSDYIVSGSDCGHLFIWDKKSEAIVLREHADEKGAVNVLEGHPYIPVLATSGLDSAIKIWEPLNKFKKPDKTELRMCVVRNTVARQRLRRRMDDTIEFVP